MSSTTANNPPYAWSVCMKDGSVLPVGKSGGYTGHVWPVRNSVNLVISKSGTGSGTVSSDGKINCGSMCIGMYSRSLRVTLTAEAIGGSTFAGWSGGGCSGTSSCTITMNSDTTIRATFNLIPASSSKPATEGN
ncbi:MAG: hypothetical protein HQK89_16210 [Nitrospirae bacterium]|nr:hypothetical protein [Nitrospirota bacterium]